MIAKLYLSDGFQAKNLAHVTLLKRIQDGGEMYVIYLYLGKDIIFY